MSATSSARPRTMFEKIWDKHVVRHEAGQPTLLYIDTHLVHEVTSAQAFDGLRLAGRKVRRPDLTFATSDHNVPTTDRSLPIVDDIARAQIEALTRNCAEFGLTLYDINHPRQGIVHVLGPELGLTQPGQTLVAGDSHTATHGALGALAFGIGTSEVEHVLATQTVLQDKSPTMEVRVTGRLGRCVKPKDVILALIGQIGTDGATGYAIEYTGEAIREMSMEGRMTVCNMTIEAGARCGMVAPDEKTFAYLKGREFAPKGAEWDAALAYWRTLPTDEGAAFDCTVELDASKIVPMVTWGTSPGQVVGIDGRVPDPADCATEAERSAVERAIAYTGLEPGMTITDIKIDVAYIGACTNGRLEDIRAAAKYVKGRKVAPSVRALLVPGSGLIKRQAEAEGLDVVFKEAGFEWREAGCSMCLGMNPDILQPGERSASTSNRNFEGRQGRGSRTHLCSPEMAAAAAIAGHFVDIRQWEVE